MKFSRVITVLLAAACLAIVAFMSGTLIRMETHPLYASEGVQPQTLSQSQQTDQDHEDSDIDEGDDDDNLMPPADAAISKEQAKAIAETAYPGSAATEVEYEKEDGLEGYEVELDNGLEVIIEPTTGEIISTEQDD